MDREEKEAVLEEFKQTINMKPKELEEWLQTNRSKNASYFYHGSLDATRAGQKVLDIKRKGFENLNEEDFDHMSRAVGFIKRRLLEQPFGYLNESKWRFSLMNWGHDPLKKHN